MSRSAWSARGPSYASSPPHLHGPSLPKLLALARPLPSDVCLDLGTGAGHTAAHLAERAAQVVALDPAEGMLAAARERYGGLANVRFHLASADATGLEGASFDLVTARHTLHHHADVRATLREVARLLKPGGRFVLVDEVTPDAAVDAWYDELERLRDPTHVRAHTLTEWRALVADAGLEWIVGDTETRYELEVAPWVERTALTPEQAEAVYAQFRRADAHARTVFKITFEGDRAVRFAMPMALLLALKADPLERRA